MSKEDVMHRHAMLIHSLSTAIPSSWNLDRTAAAAKIVHDLARKKTMFPAWSFDRPGWVSYARNGKDTYDNKRRSRLRLVRFMIRHTKAAEMLTHSEINDWCETALKDAGYGIKLEVEVTDKVVDAYADCFGSDSCMTGQNGERAPIMRIVQDGFGAKIALAKTECDEYRALIWETRCGATVFDRVYPSDGSRGWRAFTDWGKANYDFRYHDRAVVYDAFDTPHRHLMVVSKPCALREYQWFPYLDTFRFGHYHEARERYEVAQIQIDSEWKDLDGYHGINPFLPSSERRRQWHDDEDEDEENEWADPDDDPDYM